MHLMIYMLMLVQEPTLLFSKPLDQWDIFSTKMSRPLVAADATGLVLGDKDGCRFLLMSPSGALIKAIGKRGQGPGEFQRVVVITKEGDIAVWDGSLLRMQIFQRNGTYLRGQTFSGVPRQPLLTPSGRFFYIQREQEASGLLSYKIREWDRSRIWFEGKGPSGIMMEWVPRVEYAVNDEWLAASVGTERKLYLVSLVSGKETTAELEIPVLSVSDAYFDGVVNSSRNKGKGLPTSMIPKPKDWPYVRNLILDGQNRVWVFGWQESARQCVFQVFDTDGLQMYKGRIAGNVHKVTDEHIYAIYTDSEEELHLRCYRNPINQ